MKAQQSQLPLFLLVSASLLGLGIVMVASSSMSIAAAQFSDPFYYVTRQALFMIFGLGLALAATAVPLNWLQKMALPLLGVGAALLALVLIPGVGHEVNGSQRWIRFAGVGFQVTEFAKCAIIIYVASFCATHQQALTQKPFAFLRVLAPIVLLCTLILLQPDFGAVVVILGVTLGILFLAGVPWSSFILMSTLGGLALAGLAVSAPYRFARLTGFLHPWDDQFDSGYQLVQALIAFGRGGWLGEGLGLGVQKLMYLPEAHTDFIYAVIAEELGLVGALTVLLLYACWVWLGLRLGQLAYQRKKLFHAFLAYGLSLWIGLQALIAMGVNVGLLPTKGLTLPLISAGGSSLMITLIALGLLVRIHLECQQ